MQGLTAPLQILAVALALLLCQPAHSSPAISAISGPAIHGQNVTLSGSGFGAKSPAKPYLWAPFEEGSLNPSSLGVVSSWIGIANMEYNATEGVRGSGCAKASNNVGAWTLGTNASGFAWNDYGQKMYLFRKTKRNFSTQNISWKTWRVWPAGFTFPNAHLSSDNVVVEGIPGAVGWLTEESPIDAYFTEEIIVRSNSTSELADGYFALYQDGALIREIPYTDHSTKTWKMKDASETGSSPMVLNFPVHGVRGNTTFPTHYRYWADDVYLDNTWARVMIGDAPTWAASKHREIQIPTAWSGTSITLRFNAGTFRRGRPVYFYVIDSQGSVNPTGFPVTLEGEAPSTTQAPSPPRNFQAR